MTANADQAHSHDDPLRVLFVCTANICRSPMAAAVLASHAAAHRLPVAPASAGLLPGGRSTHEHVQSVMNEQGVDLSEKRSRQIDVDLLRGADLVLCMATDHVRRVIGEHVEGRSKVFLLRELSALAQSVSPMSSATWGDWLGQVNGLRKLDYRQDEPTYEVADPVDEPRPAFIRLHETLAADIETIFR